MGSADRHSVMSKQEKNDMLSNYFSQKKKLGPLKTSAITKPEVNKSIEV